MAPIISPQPRRAAPAYRALPALMSQSNLSNLCDQSYSQRVSSSPRGLQSPFHFVEPVYHQSQLISCTPTPRRRTTRHPVRRCRRSIRIDFHLNPVTNQCDRAVPHFDQLPWISAMESTQADCRDIADLSQLIINTPTINDGPGPVRRKQSPRSRPIVRDCHASYQENAFPFREFNGYSSPRTPRPSPYSSLCNARFRNLMPILSSSDSHNDKSTIELENVN